MRQTESRRVVRGIPVSFQCDRKYLSGGLFVTESGGGWWWSGGRGGGGVLGCSVFLGYDQNSEGFGLFLTKGNRGTGVFCVLVV